MLGRNSRAGGVGVLMAEGLRIQAMKTTFDPGRQDWEGLKGDVAEPEA